MAIIFHSEKYHEIKIDSKGIIGVMGYNYQRFLASLTSGDIFLIDNTGCYSKKIVSKVISNSEKTSKYLDTLGLDQSFLDKKVSELSHSEQKLFKYLEMLVSDVKIMVIDEPFQDLDYNSKKKIIVLLRRLAKNKTIIIGSYSTDVIYTLCNKVLLLGKLKFLYDDIRVLENKTTLKRFNLTMPEIVAFIKLANNKKVKLPYSKDIRDLIKDVYKNVSK